MENGSILSSSAKVVRAGYPTICTATLLIALIENIFELWFLHLSQKTGAEKDTLIFGVSTVLISSTDNFEYRLLPCFKNVGKAFQFIYISVSISEGIVVFTLFSSILHLVLRPETPSSETFLKRFSAVGNLCMCRQTGATRV